MGRGDRAAAKRSLYPIGDEGKSKRAEEKNLGRAYSRFTGGKERNFEAEEIAIVAEKNGHCRATTKHKNWGSANGTPAQTNQFTASMREQGP